MDGQIRNLLLAQVNAQLGRARTILMKEARKKLLEIQSEIPTAQSIKNELQADINSDTCSAQGMEKWNQKWNTINDSLTALNNVLGGALETAERLVELLEKLSGNVGACDSEQPDSPLGKIKQVMCDIQPYLDILRIIVVLAPLLLATFTALFSNAKLSDEVQQRRNDARDTIIAYSNLILAIPPMIENYIRQASNLYNRAVAYKQRLDNMHQQIVAMAAYLEALRNQIELNCNNFLAAESETDEFDGYEDGDSTTLDTDDFDNPDTDAGDWIGDLTTGFETYDDAINFYNDHYQNTLQTLISQNNYVGMERLARLDATFRDKYNISYTTVNINPDNT